MDSRSTSTAASTWAGEGLKLSIYHGVTPHDVVLQHRKMAVLRFHSRRTHAKPVLCIPALISRSYVLDLSERTTLVGALCEAGYDVYLVDWGYPGDEDASTTLDDVVCDYLCRAAERVRDLSGEKNVTLLGYCMGGTLAVLYAARERLSSRNNLIALAAPYDFEQGGTLARWCKREYLEIERVTEVFGTVPAHLVETVFTMLRPSAKMRAALTFAGTYDRPGSMESFRAMDRWANDWTALPGRLAREWIARFYQDNALQKRAIRIGGKRIDARAIRAKTLVVAAPGDVIVPAPSSRALQYALGSRDVTYREAAGGHIGMVAGKPAAELSALLVQWLGSRSA